jgi:hypothetical protein
MPTIRSVPMQGTYFLMAVEVRHHVPRPERPGEAVETVRPSGIRRDRLVKS